MTNQLIETIVSADAALRNRSVNSLLKNKKIGDILKIAEELEAFRASSGNLYHKVRASLFLFVIYRFFLQSDENVTQTGLIPIEGIRAAFNRKFEEAVEIYLREIREKGINAALCSAIADSYYQLSFKCLLDQVKQSISHCKENFHLFNINDLSSYPYSVPAKLTTPDNATGLYPIGMDASPVRLDPSHSGWSDIFFLGMDFPEGARVVNISVNLRVHGSEGAILPPCECYCRYIEEPVLRLTSVDLRDSKDITTLDELFNFGNDYLSLLKAGVVASGIIPPCFENSGLKLKDIIMKLLNKPGGIEVVTRVNGIPKGSRLAVSTTLLAAIITRLMRFSGQIKNQQGSLTEEERRIVASRAILGEWLGGSGGGWQDSGGLWPGIKVITGRLSQSLDAEFGISRGCLLPEYELFSRNDISRDVEERIINSMVLVHGGISQNVGPILEMVTEKYLLKYENEWKARLRGIHLFDDIVAALKAGDMKKLGRLTTNDWEGSIQHIIPLVNNSFTTDLISNVKDEFMEDYWGFLMLGGMSGGGMAFIVNPGIRDKFKERIAAIMNELKEKYKSSLPFIIDPVVYDFEFNHYGITARLLQGKDAVIPKIISLTSDEHINQHGEMEKNKIKEMYGFDSKSHEHLKSMLRKGEISLAKNRLPLSTKIDDAREDDMFHFENEKAPYEYYERGIESIKKNEVVVVTFAGGLGSRWTDGAAVVKPINPFLNMNGRFRTFIDIHLAKSRKTGELSGHNIQHVFTTSYLTHEAISNYLARSGHFNYNGKIYISPGKSIGHRVYPMGRDLKFYMEEELQQRQSENIQKVQDDIRRALIEWTKKRGEGEDYSENRHILRFNPPGHWYEVPNLIKNGTLARLLKDNPELKYLLCHNIDTMGTNIDPALFGAHILSGSCMTFEVTPRRIEDQGGGLAKVNGRIRLIEGLALPKEEDEYKLSYYNTLTNWITIDALLKFFKIDREILMASEVRHECKSEIIEAIRKVEKRMPAYVTIKNVKYIWGSGQEDVYPVAQFEKLWGDMTGLEDLKIAYASVSRYRGQQLKEPSRLNIWMMDGSFDYLKKITSF
ncbi:MAG: UTP--glucose-1-phosphate uridylyltransferase [Nitrospirae bacterium]|nr:UTP--glucose-1-phosphate uridylyltransferase [Nitrospirota bacterium]